MRTRVTPEQRREAAQKMLQLDPDRFKKHRCNRTEESDRPGEGTAPHRVSVRSDCLFRSTATPSGLSAKGEEVKKQIREDGDLNCLYPRIKDDRDFQAALAIAECLADWREAAGLAKPISQLESGDSELDNLHEEAIEFARTRGGRHRTGPFWDRIGDILTDLGIKNTTANRGNLYACAVRILDWQYAHTEMKKIH